jgi:molybdate transport system substrate-binding protein
MSELVDQPGIEIVAALPDEGQLVQIFTAAIVNTSTREQQAMKLIEFLSSEGAHAGIRKSGMNPVASIRDS